MAKKNTSSQTWFDAFSTTQRPPGPPPPQTPPTTPNPGATPGGPSKPAAFPGGYVPQGQVRPNIVMQTTAPKEGPPVGKIVTDSGNSPVNLSPWGLPLPFNDARGPIVPQVSMVRSLLTTPAWLLRAADTALQQNPNYQLMMRKDPSINNWLTLRLLSLKLLPFSVHPEDPEDPVQLARAKAIEKAIRRTARFREMIRWLALSCWYGRCGANMIYEKLAKPVSAKITTVRGGKEGQAECIVVPRCWVPIHGDSIRFSPAGDVAIAVNSAYPGLPADRMVWSDTSMAVKLTTEERSRLILHVYQIEAPDFDTPDEAEKPFGGRGLRSDLWFSWLLRSQMGQMRAMYIERFARGNLIMKYPAGVPGAQQQAELALASMIQGFQFAVPTWPEDGKTTYGFEFLEAGGTGNEIFARAMEEIDILHKQAIIGQTLTTGTGATGMGSGVAEEHADTYDQIIKSDAGDIAETLTRELVHPLKEVNFPDDETEYRLELEVETEEGQRVLDGMKKLIDMGGSVSEADARRAAGVRAPDPGEPTLPRSDGPGVEDLAGQALEGV